MRIRASSALRAALLLSGPLPAEVLSAPDAKLAELALGADALPPAKRRPPVDCTRFASSLAAAADAALPLATMWPRAAASP